MAFIILFTSQLTVLINYLCALDTTAAVSCSSGVPLVRWGGIGVLVDGQAGPCMGWCRGQCIAWCMGGGGGDVMVCGGVGEKCMCILNT